MSDLSKILTITFIIAILIFFSCNWFKGCGEGGGGRIDTISIKADTVWQDTGSIVITEKSYPVKVKGKDSLIFITVTEPQPKPEPADTAGIIEQYLTTYIYDRTYDVQYGKLRLIDTLSENRIMGRRFDLNQKIPEVTKTITIQKTKKINFGGQLGAGAMYNGKVHFGPYAGVGVTFNF